MYAVPNEATHALVLRIEFAEGEPEESVLHFGSFEACDGAARLIPATTYSGSRSPKSASLSVYELIPYCRQCGQRHEGDCEPSRVAAGMVEPATGVKAS